MRTETTKVFDKLAEAWACKPRYINSMGGTRSGKTFAALQLLTYVASNDTRPTLTSVVSETLPHLKRGAIRDFETIMETNLKTDERWNASAGIYTFANGSKMEFFSADTPAKVHGPARDRLFVNEANHIPYETFRQLAVRTRGIILVDYNPTMTFYMTDVISARENCVTIQSTYKDNEYLTAEQIAEIESNKGDANWWRVYGEGKIGQLEGLIFPDFEQIDRLPDGGNMVETYGQDYGFAHDPSTMVHCLIDTRRKAIYADEIYYRTGMLNSDMAAEMKRNDVSRSVPIYGDCAEPKTIEELHRYGYNVQPCYKATRKAEQLQMMRGYTLYVTKQSVNLIRELRGYVWQTDKDGKMLNEPSPFNDHAIDALRYGVVSRIIAPIQTTHFGLT